MIRTRPSTMHVSDVDGDLMAETGCSRHPRRATGLRCGRCSVPICYQCLMQPPVGGRCRACARLRRPAPYVLSTRLVIRTVAAVLVLGGAVGALLGVLAPRGLS